MGGYLRAIKKATGIAVVLRDKPESILERITFYDVDSKPIEKNLTVEERILHLKEIKKDISYFRMSYERAHLYVDIRDLNAEQAARRVRDTILTFDREPQEHEKSEQIM